MISLLPIPHIDYFSALHRDQPDMIALAEKMDALYTALGEEITNMQYLQDPDRCPAEFVESLGFLLSADINPADSDRQRRQKVRNAIQVLRQRGTFENDIKIRLDIITGESSAIVKFAGGAEWNLYAGLPDDPDDFTATMGFDNVNLDLGIDLTGSFTDIGTPGNILINLHEGETSPILPQDVIDQIIEDISNPDTGFLPAYYRLNLGYNDASGAFTSYTIL